MIAEMPMLQDLQQVVASRVNDLRSLQRLVTSPDFESAYKSATEDQQRIVGALIEDGNRDAVQQWLGIQERNRANIEDLTVKELRRLAASLGVKGYTYLPKASLLSQIMSAKEQKR